MRFKEQKPLALRQELERQILHGLSCEWDEARWQLSIKHQEGFRKPMFSIRDMRRKWGYWSGEKREICLSRTLVFEHSWASVREVLLHEISHQFAEEVLGADGEPPHGPTFVRACHLLRANPRASGSFSVLDERILHGPASPEDKFLARVKKLMALAKSKNQHEAEAAMAKAHELIKKYNVDLTAKDEKRDFVSFFVGKPALRHFREDYALSSLLQDFYFVYGIWVPAYVIDKGKMGRVLEISGTAQNIKIACYVNDFVKRFIDFQWEKYTKNKRLNRYQKTDFAVGIIEGFRSKLELQAPKRTKKKMALIQLQDSHLREYVNYKYPRTAAMKLGALRNDRTVLTDGIGIGKKMIISKGIEAKGKDKMALIDNPKRPAQSL
jgi:hypothetical protein